uniref:MFS domain-containing protein n=1 Tax=Schistosoma mansoni TaxID=6183 RepID=A0A5K4F3E2_SCHMA
MVTSRFYFVLLVSILSAFTSGLTFGFSSATTLQIYFNTIWAAVFGSLLNVGGVIGSLWSTWLICHYGHRRTLFLSYSLSILGWVLLFFSSPAVYERYSPTVQFILGRLLTGIGCGLTLTTNVIYVYEIIPSSSKVLMGSLFQVGITCGIVADYTLAIFLNWDVISLVCALAVSFVAFLTYMLPESSEWCVKMGNLQSAEASHYWLYGNEIPFKENGNNLIINGNVSHDLSNLSTKSYTGSSYVLIDSTSKLRTIFILMTLQQLTGMNVIIYFAESICLFGGLVSYQCGSNIGLCLFISSIVSVFVVRKFSWKKLLQVGAVILALCHLWFSLTVLTETSMSSMHQIYLIICAITFACSWGPLPLLITLESFGTVNLNYAIKSSLTVGWIVGFFVIFIFEPFISWTNVSVLFCIFSLSCLLSCGYVSFNIHDVKLMNTT